MSFSVNTNLGALNAHRNLGRVDEQRNTSLARLSTGLRINKAADDASGLAIADAGPIAGNRPGHPKRYGCHVPGADCRRCAREVDEHSEHHPHQSAAGGLRWTDHRRRAG